MKIISSKHLHGHLISTPQEVRFSQRKFKNKSYTYAEVGWSEESTDTVFRLQTFSVKKHGVMQAFKLANDFRENLIKTKNERMKMFVARVQKEMKEKKGI